MFSYLQKTLFGAEDTNSIESSDENTVMENQNNQEASNSAEHEKPAFAVGEEEYQIEATDEFVQLHSAKSHSHIMELGEKRKRLR